MGNKDAIGSVPLYTNLDRINRGLAAIGVGQHDSIVPEQLFSLDQWHYHGTDAIRAASELLGLGQRSRILDIGAGVGGPARYLAHSTGCQVTALELQPELHAIGEDLTRRCGLADRVKHVCGDALVYPFPNGAFDAVVSWLAVLHIPDRGRLCSRLAHALRSGGMCYIEDLYMRAAFDKDDLRLLREVVFGTTITSIDDYVADLRSAGFGNVVATDLTTDWAPYATARLESWRANRISYAKIHGEGAYAAQETFYAAITRLYDSGSLGGVRLVGRV